MKHHFIFPARHSLARFLIVAVAVAGLSKAAAQPFIVSTVPAIGATGVSPSAAVVFTFSEQMDTALTIAQFIDPANPFTPLPTTSVWTANDTVLTCTPTPPFPSNKTIAWFVDGESLIGDPLEGNTSGYFTTGSGGGGSGSGTNRLTEFAVGKTHVYKQTSTAAPMLDPDIPYFFGATTTLASNRTANSVSVMLPTGAISNLTQNFLRPESFFLFSVHTNLALFDNTFPVGNYVFNVMAATSNQQVTVNLPGALVQPNVPRIANFPAAQSVNSTQAFQLSWDAFAGGTAADYIAVSVGNVFKTPDPLTGGALNGAATSVTIPAGTLSPGSNYDSTITFYRFSVASNASYTTSAYLGTSTEFNLSTVSGSVTGAILFTNATAAGGNFTFDVISSAGQRFTLEYSSTMLTNQWLPLLTTTSMTGVAQFSFPITNQYLFYRVKVP